MRHLTVVSVLIAGICLIASTGFAAPRKAKASKIPAAVIIENARSVELRSMALAAAGAETKTIASIKKPIPPGKKVTLSVKGLKSCLVSVSGTFGDDGDADTETDICKDKLIRFTD